MPAPQGKEWLHNVPLEVKSVDAESHTFRGLAAAWSLDLGNDVVHKGAFERTLDHWRNAKRRKAISLLDSHKTDSVMRVVGKMSDAFESDEGLDSGWEFVPDDPTADAAYKRVKGGFVTSMSIGYTPVQFEWESKDGKRIRHLKEVKLHEVSLVVFPMNEDALIHEASIKTLADMNDEERRAYVAALPAEEKAALRALLGSEPEPTIALAPEAIKQELQTALLRLNLQQLATRARGSAPVGQTIAPMRDRTSEQEDLRKAG
jgi:HK97 family phage prohead protease